MAIEFKDGKYVDPKTGRVTLDPTVYKDWQIAEEAEKNLPSVDYFREKLGLLPEEIIPYGKTPKIDFIKVMKRLKDKPDGKFIEVTAITPTPFGEGKSTVSLGLIEGLGKLGLNVGGALRQPSGGPTMNVKGTAAGGGNALLMPMTEFSLGLTGDINDIMNAHNLAMVALNARMQHERNNNDEWLAKKGLKRLDIDPKRVEMGWVMDFCAQGLRNIIIGIGGRLDGFMMESKFGIAVGSELMAILAVARDLKDLRERIGKIVVAYSRSGEPVTCDDLEVAGAMTAWMRNTINPTMCYSVEHQPVLVHAGPFANIAIGQSSVIADRLALKLFDYHVTESGFAADIGFEKFWNVKTRLSGLTPNVSVLVATVRALKMHGGGPKVTPGAPLPKEYTEENLELLEKGTCNLFHHVNTIKKSGINPVVCINRFYTDTDAEIALLKKLCKEHGVRCAESNHWRYGGEGAIELAKAHGIACVALRNNSHWLRAGRYGLTMADAGLMGICFTNTCMNLTAWGTLEPSTGNNPITFAIPREKGSLVMDMAVSQYAYGKLEIMAQEGKMLDTPCGYDADGNPTCDPQKICESGRMMPMAMWKGSALSIMLDLCASMLSAGRTSRMIGLPSDGEKGMSQVFIAIHPAAVVDMKAVEAQMEETIAFLHSLPPIEGGCGVHAPGEGFDRTRAKNRENGIPVTEETWCKILELGRANG